MTQTTPQNGLPLCWAKPERSFEATTHNHSEIKTKQCVRLRVTQEHTLTWWLTHLVSHCRPLAQTQLHTSALRVGTWACEKKQLFLWARGRGNVRFGGVPCGKHVTFLYDNYCWRWI